MKRIVPQLATVYSTHCRPRVETSLHLLHMRSSSACKYVVLRNVLPLVNIFAYINNSVVATGSTVYIEEMFELTHHIKPDTFTRERYTVIIFTYMQIQEGAISLLSLCDGIDDLQAIIYVL